MLAIPAPPRRAVTSALTALALLTTATLTACSTNTAGAPSAAHPAAVDGPMTGNGTPNSPGVAPASPPVSYTSPGGYVFKLRQISPITAATTITTDDSSGTGGSVLDSPPGTELALATISVDNATDRPEPLTLVGAAPLPEDDGSQIIMSVPAPDAAAFGLDDTYRSNYCRTTSSDTAIAPVGYCNLEASAVAYSPAQTDILQPPQLAPGQSGTLTLAAGGSLPALPATAPLQDVHLYASAGSACNCWTPLDQSH